MSVGVFGLSFLHSAQNDLLGQLHGRLLQDATYLEDVLHSDEMEASISASPLGNGNIAISLSLRQISTSEQTVISLYTATYLDGKLGIFKGRPGDGAPSLGAFDSADEALHVLARALEADLPAPLIYNAAKHADKLDVPVASAAG